MPQETSKHVSEGSDPPAKKQKSNGWKRRGGRKSKKHLQKLRQKVDPDPTTAEGVLTKFLIPQILKERGVDAADLVVNDGTRKWFVKDKEVENVEIVEMDSKQDGIAVLDVRETDKKVVAVVPFALKGDVVKIRLGELIYLEKGLGYAKAELLSVTKSSPLRLDNSAIPCKYFGLCSGCQLQTVRYEDQLKLKRDTIVGAYTFLMDAQLREDQHVLDKIDTTVPSTLVHGYRTKLTPHYDLADIIAMPPRMPNIGFDAKGSAEWREVPQKYSSRVVDIEDCLIGTEVVRQGLANERARLRRKYDTEGSIARQGGTILLRENTVPVGEPTEASRDETEAMSKVPCTVNGHPYFKLCVTDNNAIVNEYVNGRQFTFLANEFFQNNNSILPRVIQHVQKNLDLSADGKSYLVDAYCGSGLFSIATAASVEKCIGVEISAQAVKFAKKNAALNNIENCEFIVGKAEKLFESIDFPRDKTSVILDPPRKGCDRVFLDQLSAFEPQRIVYVSCNVHSQARDVDMFLRETKNGAKYHVESIRGFDFFPQTYHVESVAVLSK